MRDLLSRTNTAPSRRACEASDVSGNLSGISRQLSRITTSTDSKLDDSAATVGALGLTTLHIPATALFDIVFVHGLGGGSRKTWSKTKSTAHYWPAEWLPKDPSFSTTRIHSYGYSSNWAGDKDNCLNVHHIGKAFLADLATSPFIGHADTSLILIGHSMGGLVIKKAYMLARQDANLRDLAGRIRAIYFVATPHRGSDSAKLLKNMLLVAGVSRGYIADLIRNSGALQAINDEFRHYSEDVELWSFYETQKLSMGVLSTLIVDPESAVLGYRGENQIPMDADHRSICKFNSPLDINYLKLRNALASTIKNITSQGMAITQDTHNETIPSVEEYLRITSNPADDLAIAQDSRLEGTCEWLQTTESYNLWKDEISDAPPILWLTGQPGAGKSVLAGFVVDDLLDSMVLCSYYSFKHGDTSKSALSTCLRSLAAQMASADENVHMRLLELQKSRARIDHDNDRSIWRLLFMSGIFQSKMQMHYWVLDGLDECGHAAHFVDSMLAKLDVRTSLRIFITSRETAPLKRSLSILDAKLCHQESISVDETLGDIKRVVLMQQNLLMATDEDEMSRLTSRIIEKAQGSFLWLHLVLEELSSCYSEDDINHVLDDVPHGMEPLYTRIVEAMSLMPRGKKLAITILSWTVCVTRPLSVQELQVALELDLMDKIPRFADTIAALCGQLVVVDKFGKVQMIHETAREFLLNEDLQSEFAIRKAAAHQRIAKTCLRYLTSDKMSPPRTGKRGSSTQGRLNMEISGFGVYACQEFSTHLAMAGPSEEIPVLVDKFFKGNILTWIEYSARTKNLGVMVRTSKNLKIYLDAHLVEHSPLRSDSFAIRSWSVDLERISAKFSDALLTSPAAIYSLIIPFCPSESAVHDVLTPWRTLSVVGPRNTRWDDRLTCIDFRQRQTALAYGTRYFAIGMTGGEVRLYHSVSCQEYRTLKHAEHAIHIHFNDDLDLVAVAGSRTYSLWNYHTGRLLKTWQTKRACAGLAFDKNLLMVATVGRELMYWNAEDLEAHEQQRPVRECKYASHEGALTFSGASSSPMALSFGMAGKMLAVAYSRRPIVLWDLTEETFSGSCGVKWPNGETSTHPVTALVLNPNPSFSLLAVSYLDGQLAILDPFKDNEVAKQHANCHTLAASPDGRLLAAGASGGVIQIFEFATLRLIYKVQSSNIFIKQLAFSADGCHLADLRGSQCNIWNPAVLLADSGDDGHSADTSTTLVEKDSLYKNSPRITAMLLVPGNGVVVCGMDNGAVHMYDMATGNQLQQLYAHKTSVRILCWLPHNNAVVSVCSANRIFSRRLEKAPDENDTPKTAGWVVAKENVVESRLNSTHNNYDPIIQVVPAADTNKVVISTQNDDFLWSYSMGQEQQAVTYQNADANNSRIWIQPPTVARVVVCLRGSTASLHSWDNLSRLASVELDVGLAGLHIKQAYYTDATGHIVLDLQEAYGSSETKEIHVINAPSLVSRLLGNLDDSQVAGLQEEDGTRTVFPHAQKIKQRSISENAAMQLSPAIVDRICHVIGIGPYGRLVFLDAQSWVCSVSLLQQKQHMGRDATTYTRHFFVPYDWLAGASNILCGVAQKDVLFAKNTEIAVIKDGLEFEEEVVL